MTDTISQETVNGTEKANEASEAPEATVKEIFDAEVAALTAGENDRVRATEFHRKDTPDLTSNHGAPSEEGGEEGGEEEDLGAESLQNDDDAEEPKGEEAEAVEPKKSRNDWKKDAIESKAALKALEEKLAALEAKESNNSESAKDPKKVTPELPPVEKRELTQEVKDLLEFTPGLDTLIQDLAAEAARVLIEKTEEDRASKFQQVEESQKVEQQEQSYWTNVDSWFKGQYPELSLSDIRESPDFNDWVEYRKNWVDTQLKSADRFETSGAQKVFERYVQENNLAQPVQEPEPEDTRKLAAARSPTVGRKNTQAPASKGITWDEEVKRLTSQRNIARTI